jgi:hypothetical protein
VSGVAVIEVAKEFLLEAMPMLEKFGVPMSITYPYYPNFYCTVRIQVDALPPGDHRMTCTTEVIRNGLTVTYITKLDWSDR